MNMILRLLLALKPHMVKLCSRCGSTAGFWIMRSNAQTVRRPWCLACISNPELDAEMYNITSFEGYRL